MGKGSFIMSKESVLFLFYMFFLIIVIVSFYTALNKDVQGILQIDKFHERIFANNVYYNECLLFNDGRVHYGVLDLQKLNNFENCMKQEKYGVRFDLNYNNEVKSFVYNQDLLNAGIFCNVKKKNLLCSNYTYYVNVYDNGEIKKGEASLWLVSVNE